MPDPEKTHAHEVDTHTELVRRLLAAQFPQWAGLAGLSLHPLEAGR
jgi:hypothetical protein